MSTDPGYVRAQIDAAKHRAGQRQTRLLIIALLGLAIVASAAVAGFFIAYGQARKNTSLTKRVITQGEQIKQLGKDQAKSAQVGRDTLKQIQDFTDPNSPTIKAQQAKVAGYLAMLDEAQRLGRADQLKKIGQMFVALGVSKGTVDRILAQPVPTITFSSAKTAGQSAGTTAQIPESVPSPAPSPTSCPGIQVAPLNLARLCIPP